MSKQQQRDTIVYGVWAGVRSGNGSPAEAHWRLVYIATEIAYAVYHANQPDTNGPAKWWVILGYSRRGGCFVCQPCDELNSAPHYAGLAALMTWLSDYDYWAAMEHIACAANADGVLASEALRRSNPAIGSRPRSAHVEPPIARPGDKGIDLGTGESYTVPPE